MDRKVSVVDRKASVVDRKLDRRKVSAEDRRKVSAEERCKANAGLDGEDRRLEAGSRLVPAVHRRDPVAPTAARARVAAAVDAAAANNPRGYREQL